MDGYVYMCSYRAARKNSLTEWITLYKINIFNKKIHTPPPHPPVFKFSNPFAPPLTSNPGSALGWGTSVALKNMICHGATFVVTRGTGCGQNVVSCDTCDYTVTFRDNSFRSVLFPVLLCDGSMPSTSPSPTDTFMEIQVSSMYTLEHSKGDNSIPEKSLRTWNIVISNL